jgi:integrating conjugative element relaxase (TIGR03760 family)
MTVDASSWLFAGGILAIAAGAYSLKRAATIVVPISKAVVEVPPGIPLSVTPGPVAITDVAVLPAADLLRQLHLTHLIESIRSRTQFSPDNFESIVVDTINAFAEMVQQLPASESHHHADLGGMLTHSIETANHALGIRRGYFLPLGAEVEQIGEARHRWTFAVMLAALLHDIGKPLVDMQVTARAGVKRSEWTPLAGSMNQQKFVDYRVEFRTGRSYQDHHRLPVLLMQRIVPLPAMQWLAQDLKLMQELTKYLSGDGADSVLNEIVTKADSESVRYNLAHGSRDRLVSAKTQPLIEKLMEQIRAMLSAGAELPLNRKGAVGWIYEGEAYFVSKRLIDDVRASLAREGKDSGVPGTDKNDRIFDTLQEFGAIVPNPITGKAIWNVTINQKDGWSESFSVLRFPLAKLYERSVDFPTSMQGSISIRADAGTIATSSQPQAVAPAASPASSPTSAIASAPVSVPISVMLTPAPADAALENIETTAPVANTFATTLSATSDSFASGDLLPLLPQIGPVESITAAAIHTLPPVAAAKSYAKFTPPAIGGSPVNTAILAPVTVATPRLAVLRPKTKSEPPVEAQQLMGWIQAQLVSGDLGVNHGSALVHFSTLTEDGQGNAIEPERVMLLVTPRIFKAYAAATGDESTVSERALSIQKAFLKAGWQVTIKPGNVNILKFMTAQKSVLNCIAVREPHQFVNPLPPDNELLAYCHELTAHIAKSSHSVASGRVPK